jgi:hypothetical protein
MKTTLWILMAALVGFSACCRKSGSPRPEPKYLAGTTCEILTGFYQDCKITLASYYTTQNMDGEWSEIRYKGIVDCERLDNFEDYQSESNLKGCKK